MYCYNHLRNVWVKKVLNLLNDFMCGHLNDSLDEIAPELCVSPNFITFARAKTKNSVYVGITQKVTEDCSDNG